MVSHSAIYFNLMDILHLFKSQINLRKKSWKYFEFITLNAHTKISLPQIGWSAASTNYKVENPVKHQTVGRRLTLNAEWRRMTRTIKERGGERKTGVTFGQPKMQTIDV